MKYSLRLSEHGHIWRLLPLRCALVMFAFAIFVNSVLQHSTKRHHAKELACCPRDEGLVMCRDTLRYTMLAGSFYTLHDAIWTIPSFLQKVERTVCQTLLHPYEAL